MSGSRWLRWLPIACSVCALALTGAPAVRAQQYYPAADSASSDYDTTQAPGRVARLAYLSGQVQFAPAGDDAWGSVEINRPMVIGDRLLTGDDGRAVLELGDAAVRLDNDSAFDFLNLAEDNVQIELSQGTLNLDVRQMAQGANFEVDTPTIAFVASTPGIYRIDNDPDGTGSMVSVFRGAGTVYGENGASREVAAGTSYRFDDSSLADVDVTGLPQPDDFDRFCEARDQNYRRYAQSERRYVPDDMIGGDDLYAYGDWNSVPEYGNVWYPSSVPVGWAPYRYGHWAWIDPWGWTWIDNQPWGFAPFHYGRWVYVRNRWGWIPGPVDVRPVYAPALVAFIGGSGLSVSLRVGGGVPVGWFPLGPRDVYVPWFHASRRYFTNVNVTNIRNVYVNKTVINNFYTDYRHGRVPPRGGPDYAYRRMPGAVTAVPRNIFTDARPVHPAVLKLDRTRLAGAHVALRPDVNPGPASLGLKRPTKRPIAVRDREPFARPVVARHQPPPRPIEFAARRQIIASQDGQPLTPAQMRGLHDARVAGEPREPRVKLVGPTAGEPHGTGTTRHAPVPPRPAEPAARIVSARPDPAHRPDESPARRTGPAEPFRNTVHPIQVPIRTEAHTPRRPDELAGARFAHPDSPRSLPRAPVIRPAQQPPAVERGQLPVVRPIEPAPRALVRRDQPRQPGNDAPRRVDTPVRPQPHAWQEPPREQRPAPRTGQEPVRPPQPFHERRETWTPAPAPIHAPRAEPPRHFEATPVRPPQHVEPTRPMREPQPVRVAPPTQTRQSRERPAPRAEHREPPPRKHPSASSDGPIR